MPGTASALCVSPVPQPGCLSSCSNGPPQQQRVLMLSTALVVLASIEVVLNFASNNLFGAGLALAILLVPACGWAGVHRKQVLLVQIFAVANAVCVILYFGGAMFLAGVVIPSLRCLCDPACDSAPSSASAAMEPQHALHFHGEVDDIELEGEYMHTDICDQVGALGLYVSVVLSLAATLVHALACLAGHALLRVMKKQHQHQQQGVAAAGSAALAAANAAAGSARSGIGHAPPQLVKSHTLRGAGAMPLRFAGPGLASSVQVSPLHYDRYASGSLTDLPSWAAPAPPACYSSSCSGSSSSDDSCSDDDCASVASTATSGRASPALATDVEMAAMRRIMSTPLNDPLMNI